MSDADLADLRKQCITSLYLCTDNVSKYLDNEKENEFAKLRGYVEDYCKLEAQQDVAIQALESVKRDTDSSNLDSFMHRFDEQLGQLAGRRLNASNHPYMAEFKKRTQKSQKASSQNLDESDVAITESASQFIDPITKRPIVDPVKNIICGHIYEKESIFNLIQMKNRTRCPVVGCGHKELVTKQNLIADEELKFQMTVTQHSTMMQERSIMDLDDTM